MKQDEVGNLILIIFRWTHTYWYTFLDKVLPGAGLMTVVKKVLLDQTISSVSAVSSLNHWQFILLFKKVNSTID